MNNRMTGLRFASVLLPALIMIGLSGCSSSKPAVQADPMDRAEPMEIAEESQQTDSSSIAMTPGYPERYVVVTGDTLWDISKRFLKDPWLWPSVWHINPSIRNPHLIYPGDIIIMRMVDGKPYITLDGKAGTLPPQVTGSRIQKITREYVKPGLKTVKLTPSIRISGLHKAISTIPMNAIRPFLDRPRVITDDDIDDAPYIISSYEDHLISSTGNRIYAIEFDKLLTGYDVVRPGREYIDPDSGDVLGYEAIYLADARVINYDASEDVATLMVIKASREILKSDILLPHEEREEMFQFTPRSPEVKVEGQIMAVFDGVSQIGQYMVVVLNRGEEEGLAPGHVLAIMKKGAIAQDPYAWFFSDVELPDERAGIMMVFKTYQNLSYALIMEANRVMHINDRFQNP